MIHFDQERPIEWLSRLKEDSSLYASFLQSTGSLAVAAYRLARARCQIQPVWTSIPTVRELLVAAREIVRHTGCAFYPANLVDECLTSGLMVITPISQEAA